MSERLTNPFSVMGRKYDLAFGQANTWKRKLKNDKYELIENAIDKLGQYEDIEEELDIDLLDYLKQIAKGIKQIREDNVKPNGVIVYIKGATYRITKEELENEK